jgi:hypothetical protein
MIIFYKWKASVVLLRKRRSNIQPRSIVLGFALGNNDLWHDGDDLSGMMRDESATAKSFVLLLSCSAS